MQTTDPRLEDYCLKHSSLPSKDCERIYDFTRANVPMAIMLVGPLEGSFLAWMVRSLKAKRVLEIGTFTGYSALCMAEHLPPEGELITCDLSPETTKIAQKFWNESKHGSKIKVHVGPAIESLQKISGKFELIFIDADKDSYFQYFERALELLAPGGAILLDNCLRDGQVLEDYSKVDSGTQAIIKINEMIVNRPDLLCCLLPLRDGVMMVQRKAAAA